jgi:RHS repeat-associated protein
MTNASGAEVKDYDYQAFGTIHSISGAERNEREFTGHIRDAETQLIYMGARYYDAALGRFISADTIIASLANPQSLNRYAYAYNNPINNTDPTGHWVPEGGEPNPKHPSKPKPPSNGNNNPPPNGGNHANDYGGDEKNRGSDPDTLPRPNIFVGTPADVAAAWDLLEAAAAYGPKTRAHIVVRLNAVLILRGYGVRGLTINLERDKLYRVGNFDTNSIDLGDIEKLPNEFFNPLAPANALLHEFTEQYEKQIAGQLDFSPAHHIAIDAENMANSERYAHGSVPVRSYADDIPTFLGDTNFIKSMTIVYDTVYPNDIHLQARVTLFTTPFSAQVEWR